MCVCAVAGRGCVHVCEKERGEGEEGGREREVGERERGRRIDCRSARMLRCVGQGTASHLCGLAAARGACARRRPGRRQRPSASHPSLRTAIKRVVSEECGIGGNNLCGLSAREDTPRQDRGYPQSSTRARCLLPGDCACCVLCVRGAANQSRRVGGKRDAKAVGSADLRSVIRLSSIVCRFSKWLPVGTLARV